MRSCIIPGSYDPVTSGHTSLFRTASELFDKVYVVIAANTEKKSGFFSPEERLQILTEAIDALKAEGFTNIEPILHSGLITDCASELGAKYIVKGVRNANDFTYEYDLSQIMKRFDESVETIFLPSESSLACVSSTYVRELIKYGKFDSKDFAKGTASLIRKLYNK